jgi:hypothetical protein
MAMAAQSVVTTVATLFVGKPGPTVARPIAMTVATHIARKVTRMEAPPLGTATGTPLAPIRTLTATRRSGTPTVAQRGARQMGTATLAADEWLRAVSPEIALT